MFCENNKQYFIEFGVSMVLYIAAVLISVSVLIAYPTAHWRVWIAVLPVLPAILGTIAFVRRLTKLDELQQRIQLASFAISFAVTGLTTFTYGFLENAGFPHIPYVWVFPFMIATWGITTPLVARVYK